MTPVEQAEHARAAAAEEVSRLRAIVRGLDRRREEFMRSHGAESHRAQQQLAAAVVRLHAADLALQAARGEPPGDAA